MAAEGAHLGELPAAIGQGRFILNDDENNNKGRVTFEQFQQFMDKRYDPFRRSLGLAIRHYREKHYMSRERLAARTHSTESIIESFEVGRENCEPSLGWLLLAADVLEVDILLLMGRAALYAKME